VVTLLAAVVSPLLILLLSTGSPDANQAEYISAGIPLALLFAPQVFFYGLMAVWSAALNARHRFLAAAWTPVLNNLIAIAALVAVFVMVDGKPTLACWCWASGPPPGSSSWPWRSTRRSAAPGWTSTSGST
jgi:peptidoglycan biosynthesis protein MviN/MurJ (putative lipid II flippase)